MSRADWSFLEHLLEEGQEYQTPVGRVWLTVLFLFRMLVLGAAAESAWDDEQCSFVCNTQQPGCAAVCYDRAFPVSHFRYFVLQVIFVSTPTVFYFGYVAVRATAAAKKHTSGDQGEEEEEEEVEEGEGGATEVTFGGSGERKANAATSSTAAARSEKELEEIEEDGGEKGGKHKKNGGKSAKGEASAAASQAQKLKGRLLGAYAGSVLATVLLEAGFIAGLWMLYGGFLIAARYECVGPPCPHTVDCFVSRPTEKSIFTVYTQAIACLSLVLNLAELLHLLQLAVSQRLERRYRRRRHRPPDRRSTPLSPWRSGEQTATLSRLAEAEEEGEEGELEEAPSYQPPSGVVVPVGGYPELPRSYVVGGVGGGGHGVGDSESDIPPSYLNCLGGMSSSRSPRSHTKRHIHGMGKHRKDSHKGHSKLKHYV